MLFSIFLQKLRELYVHLPKNPQTMTVNLICEHRVTAIISNTAQYRLFRPVRSDLLSTVAKTHFIKLNFINKGIDTVNLSSVLRSKSVIEIVPTCFKEKEPPIVPYTYTKTITSKIFNFSLRHFQAWIITSFTAIHLSVNVTPQAIYINPKYRETCKVDWDKNLSLLCDAVD